MFDPSRCIQSIARCNEALSFVFVPNSSHPGFDIACLANPLKKDRINLQRLIPDADETLLDLECTFYCFDSQEPAAALNKVILVLLCLERNKISAQHSIQQFFA